MPEIFIALGSNLGDREHNLRQAVAGLHKFADVSRVSSIYETRPKYVEDQPQFLNMVVVGTTNLPALDLLAQLKNLETSLGRTFSKRYGPRKIDLDIIFYGDDRIELPDLTIPHPGLEEREFVLRPLADIAPEKSHPVSGKTIRELLDALNGEDVLNCFVSAC